MCIPAFLDGTRRILCVQQLGICVFLHSWNGRAGVFESSSCVYVYSCIPGQDAQNSLNPAAAHMCIPAFLDGTRRSLRAQQLFTCAFMHFWTGRAELVESSSRVYVHSCIPGRDARESLSPAAAYMCIRAFLHKTRGTLRIQQLRICVFLCSRTGVSGLFESSSRVDMYSCISGRDAHDSLSLAAAYMCVFQHFRMGCAGLLEISSRVYVYSCIPGLDARESLSPAAAHMCIPAFLDRTCGTLCVQQPRICEFLHSWTGPAGLFESSNSVSVYSCVPGRDARE